MQNQPDSKACAICGQIFIRPDKINGPDWHKKRTCGPACAAIQRWNTRGRKTHPPCKRCGKPVPKLRMVYCSRACRKVLRTCAWCGEEKSIRSGRQYCSRECSAAAGGRLAGERLVDWRRRNPETQEQRERRSIAMRERWASMSDAERQRMCEMSRQTGLKTMSDPKARARIGAASREAHRRNGYKKRFDMTPEIRAKISASQMGKRKEWMDDPDKLAASIEKHSLALSARFKKLGQEGHELFRPDVRERALANSAKEGKTNPLRGRFETNIAAKDWHLRSPDGEMFHIRNLRHFIRNHRHLFSARQLEIKGPGGRTRVESCLSTLSPRRKFPVTCSQGWTWVSFPHEADPRLNTPPSTLFKEPIHDHAI